MLTDLLVILVALPWPPEGPPDMSLGSALAFEVWGRGSGDWSLGFSVLGFRFGLRALANLGLETAETRYPVGHSLSSCLKSRPPA